MVAVNPKEYYMQTKEKYSKADAAEVEKAKGLIYQMGKRHKLKLINVHRALCAIENALTEEAILDMRAKGMSVRAIARAIHMDDRHVSAIIKANVGKSCKKPCKPNKPWKPCKKPCNKSCKK